MMPVVISGSAHGSIPAFPLFRELSLGDRDEIMHELALEQPKISELTFTSLFIWRHTFHTAAARYGQWLIFLERWSDGSLYFLPPVGKSSPPELAMELLLWLKTKCAVACPAIERADARLLEGLDRRAVHIEPMPDHFDYLYSREKLSTLAGRHLSAKRNQIKQFRCNHHFEVDELRSKHLNECLRILEEWTRHLRNRRGDDLQTEYQAVWEALECYEHLPVEGTVIIVGKRMEAFAISEPLNAVTQVVQIEKAGDNLTGLYPLLTQQSALSYRPEVVWVNRAQDLGIAGLKQSKQSWHPDHLVRKFHITLSH
jgi:uncharacterized protein